jgi:uncharacterized protein DUF4350
MPAARKGTVWLIVLLLAMFLAGAWEVMIAPLITGEVYPAYSSLRTDPLGTMALFESLSEQPGLDVTRLYKARSPLDSETTLLILGVDPLAWTKSPTPVADDYEKLVAKGGRVVIAFLPAAAPKVAPNAGAIEEQWHIRLRYRKASNEEEGNTGAIPRESALHFEPGPEWRVLEKHQGDAVIVERDLSGGTLVLVGDSFPLSNQGLSDSREAGLIATLIGPAKQVLFDENQFGVSETGSVAVLIRKYRLETAIGMLFAIAGLFIWHSGSSFLPPRANIRAAPVTGRDLHEGLAALLRRNIPIGQLLPACWKEWIRSAPQRGRAEMVQSEIQQWTGRDPAAGYRAICRVLTERK